VSWRSAVAAIVLDCIPAAGARHRAQALRDAWAVFILDAPTPLHDHDVWYRARFPGAGKRTLPSEGLCDDAEVCRHGQLPVRLGQYSWFFCSRRTSPYRGNNELAIVFRSLDKALEAKKGRARCRTRLVETPRCALSHDAAVVT